MKRKTRRWIFFIWLIVGLIGLPVFWVKIIGETAVMSSMSLKFWYSFSFIIYMIVGGSLNRWAFAKKKIVKTMANPSDGSYGEKRMNYDHP